MAAQADARVLKCQKSVEESGRSCQGVYFDVANESPNVVLVVGLVAGLYFVRGHATATAYACTAGASTGSEAVPGSWEELWSGTLLEKQSTDVLFQKPVALKPGETRGFFLHSKRSISLSNPDSGRCANNDLSIAPGKFTFSTEPFTHIQDSALYTHAGAIKYRFEAKKAGAEAKVDAKAEADAEAEAVLPEDCEELRMIVGGISPNGISSGLQCLNDLGASGLDEVLEYDCEEEFAKSLLLKRVPAFRCKEYLEAKKVGGPLPPVLEGKGIADFAGLLEAAGDDGGKTSACIQQFLDETGALSPIDLKKYSLHGELTDKLQLKAIPKKKVDKFWSTLEAPDAAAPLLAKAAALSSSKMMPEAEPSIEILPFTKWGDIQPQRTFVEELQQNDLLRRKLDDADQLADDVQSKMDSLRYIPEAVQLTKDMDENEEGAILAFTHDHGKGKPKNYYFEMNCDLRIRDLAGRTNMMKCWGNSVHWQLKGMAKLPNFEGDVIRGLPDRSQVIKEYQVGRPIQWGAFVSTATSAESAKGFGDKSTGILIKIKLVCGRQLGPLSFFPNETEVVVSPNAKFTVVSKPYQDSEGWWYLDLVQQQGKCFVF